jgi:hypothetical protein
VEGTNYTTGCWSYKSQIVDVDNVCKRSQQQFSRGETLCKITPTMIRDKGLYGAIQSLFSPELLYSHGIAQIELAQGTTWRRGANTSSVMQYDDAVRYIPVRFKVEGSQDTIKQLQFQAYPAVVSPQPPLTTTKELQSSSSRPRVDFCVRFVDWTPQTKAELEGIFDLGELRAQILYIQKGLRLVHVTA